jgi:hypothetical protein
MALTLFRRWFGDRLWRRQDAPQAGRELFHCAFWFIGAHVWYVVRA